jgi:LysR family transcriptional regulator of gallate degradation
MSVKFINLRHLKAFKEVASQGGISAAAVRVHLSQPAVPQAITRLEEHFGTPLFERRRNGMFVTQSGAALHVRVQNLFQLLDNGADDAVRSAARRSDKPNMGFQNQVTASQLRALVAIWETGGFSLAARAIGISQPSIHRAGRDLEKLSGMTLFVSSRKGIELTPQAEPFARAVKLAAAELRQGYDEITRLSEDDNTTIVVGSMPLSRTSILPEAIDKLLVHGASIQVRTVDGPYAELLRGLRHGDLDVLVGALRDPLPSDDVIQEPLLDDSLAIVVGPHHPLAHKSNLSVADTMTYPWIAPPKATPTGTYLYHMLDIENADVTPVRVVSSSLVLVRGLLSKGNYVTLISLQQTKVERAQGLIIPLDISLPKSTRSIGLTYRADWKPTPTQTNFFDLLRQAATHAATPTYT